jgi:hypothetical protein
MIPMLLEKGAHVDIDSIREILTSGTGFETESEQLMDELADVSGLSLMEFAQLLSRVSGLQVRRYELLLLGPNRAQENERKRAVLDST